NASSSWNRPENAEQIDNERLSIRRQCRRHICSFMDRHRNIDCVRGQHRDHSDEKNQKSIRQCFKFHRPSGLYFFRNVAVQLRTIVIGVLPALVALDSGRGMRNRCPSGETAKKCDGPACANLRTVYPESKRGRGTDDSNFDSVALITTEYIFPEEIESR